MKQIDQFTSPIDFLTVYVLYQQDRKQFIGLLFDEAAEKLLEINPRYETFITMDKNLYSK